MGIYLGDCVTTAIVCSIGAKADQKRVGIVNILFNLSETVLVLAVVSIIHALGGLSSIWDMSMTPGTIANTNTIFNLGCAILLMPLVNVYEKLSRKIVKDDKAANEKYDEVLSKLSPSLLESPALAFNSCYEVLRTMLNSARNNIDASIGLIAKYDEKKYRHIEEEEEHLDMMTDSLCNYLVQLSPYAKEDKQVLILDQYNKLVTEYERLGDHAMNIAESAKELQSHKTPFSDEAMEEVQVLKELLDRILDCTVQAFEKRDVAAAKHIEPLEDVMDDMVNKIHDNHLRRLRDGKCTSHIGISFLDILNNLERISDTCSNVGISVVARVYPELAILAHDYVTSLHQGSNNEFTEEYNSAHEEFSAKLSVVEKKYIALNSGGAGAL